MLTDETLDGIILCALRDYLRELEENERARLMEEQEREDVDHGRP